MELTQKQRALVDRYLRDISSQLDTSLPARVRQRGIERIELKITRRLEALNKGALEDADVLTVLRRLGSSGDQAATVAPGKGPAGQVLRLDTKDPVWLGVCAGLANWIEIPAWMVRLVAALLCVTGPLVLLAYIGFFVAMYFMTPVKERPRVRPSRIAFRVGVTLVAIVLLDMGTDYLLELISSAHIRFLGKPVPHVGEFNWLGRYEDTLYFWVFALGLPFAALSGMPLAKGWDHSLKRLSQAIVALYGMGLSFGIASFLVGIIMQFVRESTGGGFIDFLNLSF